MEKLVNSTPETRELIDKITTNLKSIYPDIYYENLNVCRNFLLNKRIIARAQVNKEHIRIELRLDFDTKKYPDLVPNLRNGKIEKSMPSSIVIDLNDSPDFAIKYILLSLQYEINKGEIISAKNIDFKKIEQGKLNNKTQEYIEINDQEAYRYESIVSRFSRDNRTIQQLKELYNFKCQICGESIIKYNKKGKIIDKHIEVHHIIPKRLSKTDKPGNLLVLCPNHHAEFHIGALIIEPKKLIVHHTNPNNKFHGKKIIVENGHIIDEESLIYHNNEL